MSSPAIFPYLEFRFLRLCHFFAALGFLERNGATCLFGFMHWDTGRGGDGDDPGLNDPRRLRVGLRSRNRRPPCN